MIDNYNVAVTFGRKSTVRSPNIVRVIKFGRLQCAGHVFRMEEDRSAFKILTGKPRGKRTLGKLGVVGRAMQGIGLMWRRIGIIGEPL